MNLRRNRLRSIGLALIAVAMPMAIGAASAQATGNWRVEGANIGAGEEREFVAEEDQMFEFLVTTLNLEILCGELEINEGKLFAGGSSLAAFVFKQCESFFTNPTLKRASACDPVGGTIKLLAKGLLLLHNKKTYERFSPDLGENFGTVSFGEACSLVGKWGISGSFVIEDCSGNGLEAELVRHLVQQAPAALFPSDVLLFGSKAMRLDGSTRLKLAGADEGKFWSGLT